MNTRTRFAEIASLMGDPARAAMLHALMDGRALTAGELARVAGVAPQTASGHLGRLVTAGLVALERQGRHRYHRLADAAVARMIEGVMQVASGMPQPKRAIRVGPREAELRQARTCYDHLAGQLGVALADSLTASGIVALDGEAAQLAADGEASLLRAGINISALQNASGRRSGRIVCRPCLDWSERRSHLAGVVGAAICAHAFEVDWVRRREAGRGLIVTPKGQRAFRSHFGVVPTDDGFAHRA